MKGLAASVFAPVERFVRKDHKHCSQGNDDGVRAIQGV